MILEALLKLLRNDRPNVVEPLQELGPIPDHEYAKFIPRVLADPELVKRINDDAILEVARGYLYSRHKCGLLGISYVVPEVGSFERACAAAYLDRFGTGALGGANES
ncbi:MAG TPA: hypothetical protein VFE88_02400 [Candidatus Nanoarchaeia archaeon]|nr:hypothetical protein [Candidatus Nanoarchaeia archaeon]